MFSEFIRGLFYFGLAPRAVTLTAAINTYVFFLTFVVCLFDRELRRAKKTFFTVTSFFSCVMIFGVTLLDYISARYFSLFEAVLTCIISLLVFTLEYGILALQSKIAVKQKPQSAADSGDYSSIGNSPTVAERSTPAVAASSPQTPISPVKHVKTCKIYEVPLRKREVRVMDAPCPGNVLSERYLSDCISRLKGKQLSPADAERLSVIEKKLSSCRAAVKEDKRAVNEACGALVTMLAKYS